MFFCFFVLKRKGFPCWFLPHLMESNRECEHFEHNRRASTSNLTSLSAINAADAFFEITKATISVFKLPVLHLQCPQVEPPRDCQHFLTGARAKVRRLYMSCWKEIEQLTAQAKGSCPRTDAAAVIALCSPRSVCRRRPTNRLCVFFSYSRLTVSLFLWHLSRWRRTWPNVHAGLFRSPDGCYCSLDPNDGDRPCFGCQKATTIVSFSGSWWKWLGVGLAP